MRRVGLVLLSLFLCWGPSWAQEASTSLPEETGPSSLPSEPTLPSMIEIASSSRVDTEELVRRLEQRKRQAGEQAQNSQTTAEALSNAIETEKSESLQSSEQATNTEQAINASQTASTATSSSLDELQPVIDSLRTDFAKYKSDSEGIIRRHSLTAALWRACALSATFGLAGALGGPALGLPALPCAGYAAAGGATVGLVWGVVELWPIRR